MAPSDWLPILSAIKEVVVTLAAATGASVAVYGVHTWRRQLAGSAEWDLARRLLRRVYAVRDSIYQVRGIFMNGAETEAALKKTGRDNVQGADRVVEGLAAGYEVRWAQVQAALSDLGVEALDAEVLWGQQAVAALDPLRKCVKEMQVYLSLYLYYQRKPPKASSQELEKAERVVFPIPNEAGNDQFADQLSAAVTTAEGFVRPHLSQVAGRALTTYLDSSCQVEKLTSAHRTSSHRL